MEGVNQLMMQQTKMPWKFSTAPSKRDRNSVDSTNPSICIIRWSIVVDTLQLRTGTVLWTQEMGTLLKKGSQWKRSLIWAEVNQVFLNISLPEQRWRQSSSNSAMAEPIKAPHFYSFVIWFDCIGNGSDFEKERLIELYQTRNASFRLKTDESVLKEPPKSSTSRNRRNRCFMHSETDLMRLRKGRLNPHYELS